MSPRGWSRSMVFLLPAPFAAAASEAASLCLFPVATLTLLGAAIGWLLWLLLPLAMIAGYALGRLSRAALQARLPPALIRLLLVLGLGLGLWCALANPGMQTTPGPIEGWLRWGRCNYPADALRALGALWWMPLLGALGAAAALIRASRSVPNAPLPALLLTSRADPGGRPASDAPRAAAQVDPELQAKAAALTATLPNRVAAEPVDADTRARIAAAVARQQRAAGTASPPPE